MLNWMLRGNQLTLQAALATLVTLSISVNAAPTGAAQSCLTESPEANEFCVNSVECELVMLEGACTPMVSYSLSQSLRTSGTGNLDPAVHARSVQDLALQNNDSAQCDTVSGDFYDYCRQAVGCEVVYDRVAGCVPNATYIFQDPSDYIIGENDDNTTSITKRGVWYETKGFMGRNRKEFGDYQPRWAYHKVCYDTTRETGVDASHYITMGTKKASVTGTTYYDIVGHGTGWYYGWGRRDVLCTAVRELAGNNERHDTLYFYHGQWRTRVAYKSWTAEDYIQLNVFQHEDGRHTLTANKVEFWVEPRSTSYSAGCAIAGGLASAAGIFWGATGGVLGVLTSFLCA